MKTAVVSIKEMDPVECMSAARFVEYTKEDFKDISNVTDLQKLCRMLGQPKIMKPCAVEKCNLKQAIRDHFAIIEEGMRSRCECKLSKTMQEIKDSVRLMRQ